MGNVLYIVVVMFAVYLFISCFFLSLILITLYILYKILMHMLEKEKE
jgi:hypothetical protein